MSGHNPHGRLGQPSWNHLQVPSFIPRQPQLAHMSNERPILGAPPLGWPPVHSAESIYGYMAAAAAASAAVAASANHKGSPLDLNPLLPAFVRQSNGLPFGSVDLSISSTSRNSLTPSPLGMPSPVTTSTPLSSKPSDSQQANNNCKSPALSEGLGQSTLSDSLSNIGNGSLLPAAIFQMLAAKSHASVSISPPPSCSNTEQSNKNHNAAGSNSGLFIRDAQQINNDITKLASVVAAAAGETNGPKEFSDPMELVKGINYLNNKHSTDSHLGGSSVAPEPPPPTNPFLGISAQGLPPHLAELSKSLGMVAVGDTDFPTTIVKQSSYKNYRKTDSRLGFRWDGLPPQLNLQPPVRNRHIPKSPAATFENGNQPPIRSSPRKKQLTSTDDSHDDSSTGMCNGNSIGQRKSRYRRRKPKKTQRLSNENSVASPAGSDNMDIDDSIIKSLDETEIESNNARRTVEQFGALVPGPKTFDDKKMNAMPFENEPLPESNGLNFEDIIPLCKTKIPQLATINGIDKVESYSPRASERATTAHKFDSPPNMLDYTKDHLDKRADRSVDDVCDIDKIAEIVAKTVSASENVPFMHIPSSHPGLTGHPIIPNDSGGMRNETNRQDEDKPLLQNAQVKVPTTSSPIPSATVASSDDCPKNGFDKVGKMFAGAIENEYKSFETELTLNKSNDVLMDAKGVTSSQATNGKQEGGQMRDNEDKTDDKSKDDNSKGNTTDKKDGDTSESNVEASTGATTNSNANTSKRKPTKGKQSARKNSGGINGKGNKKRPIKKKGRIIKNGKSNGGEKKVKVKEETTVNAETLNKYRGPYVQIEKDGSEIVINAPITEEVAEKQSKLKKIFVGHNANDRNKIRGLHVSTLSTKYDAATTDRSWMCVFCKLGPHKYSRGDLFGPYILSIADADFQLSQIDPSEDLFRSQRTKLTMLQSRGISVAAAKGAAAAINGDMGKVKGRKRKITETDSPSTSASTSTTIVTEMPDIFYGMTKVADDSYEVWTHEDCIVWSSGVHVIGVRIIGLAAAVWGSSRHKCNECGQYGAILSCLQRGCTEEAHFPCAKRSGWDLDENEFKSRCSKHRTETTIE